MQFELKGILLVICAIIAVIVIFKVAKKLLKFFIIACLVGVFLVGSNIIDLNTISPEVQQKVEAVAEVIGDSAIKVKGKAVLINIGDEWYDISKIAVIGDLATESVSINYDGQDVYVGETGLVNVLRVLESFGLLQPD